MLAETADRILEYYQPPVTVNVASRSTITPTIQDVAKRLDALILEVSQLRATHAPLSIVADASNFAIGAALQQQTPTGTQPLAFYSAKLTPPQTRYSTFGRELLAIYLAIKHFRNYIEGRDFCIYTDHKPLTYALSTSSDKYSPRETRHLDFISQYTTDIRFLKGLYNQVADCLSRPGINAITRPSIALERMAELRNQPTFTESLQHTSLQLEAILLSTTPGTILYDISRGASRPVVPNSVAHAFLEHWISHNGIPSTITTDRGQQFESRLFNNLTDLLGCSRIRTTAYHPSSNGLVERFHRQLKASLRAHDNPSHCSEHLPLVMLGIRTALKPDLECPAAELVYGTSLRILGDFFGYSQSSADLDPSDYVQRLRQAMTHLRATPPRPPTIYTIEARFLPPATEGLPTSSVSDIVFSEGIVRRELEALSELKSSGPDEIPPKLLKELASELSVPFSMLFQT
ncbi:hypothetical protein SprV_0401413200 [Sparganum proliferum]